MQNKTSPVKKENTDHKTAADRQNGGRKKTNPKKAAGKKGGAKAAEKAAQRNAAEPAPVKETAKRKDAAKPKSGGM